MEYNNRSVSRLGTRKVSACAPSSDNHNHTIECIRTRGLSRCVSCSRTCVSYTHGNNSLSVYCYHCWYTQEISCPQLVQVPSQINGSQGEATNTDDLAQRREPVDHQNALRARREARNRMVHGAVGEGRHRRVRFGPPVPPAQQVAPAPAVEPNVQPPPAPVPQAPVQNPNAPIVAPAAARPIHNIALDEVKIYLIHEKPSLLGVANAWYWPLLQHITYAFLLDYVSCHAMGYSDEERLRCQILLASTHFLIRAVTLKWFCAICATYVVIKTYGFTTLSYVALLHFYSLLYFMWPTSITDTFFTLDAQVFVQRVSTVSASGWWSYSSSVLGFDAYQTVQIDRNLLKLLQFKHPCASPREHTIQVLMSTTVSELGRELCTENHDLFLRTCEYYYQELIRQEHRRKMLGVRKTMPVA